MKRHGNAEVIVILILFSLFSGASGLGYWIANKCSVINLCSKYVVDKGKTICVLRDSLTLKESLERPNNVVIKDPQDYLSFSSPEKAQEIQEIVNDLNRAIKERKIKYSFKEENKNFYALSIIIPKAYLKKFYEYCEKTGKMVKIQLKFNAPLIKKSFSYSLGILSPDYYDNVDTLFSIIFSIILFTFTAILLIVVFGSYRSFR